MEYMINLEIEHCASRCELRNVDVYIYKQCFKWGFFYYRKYNTLLSHFVTPPLYPELLVNRYFALAIYEYELCEARCTLPIPVQLFVQDLTKLKHPALFFQIKSSMVNFVHRPYIELSSIISFNRT